MVYIVLGAPGVGKGTRAKVLCEELGIPHISTGSLIRESKEIFEKYKSMMGDGKLLPDEAIKEMLVERLKKDDAKKGFVLDGYPRTLAQVNDLDEILEKMGTSITKAFLFKAPEEEIFNRALNRRVCVACDKIYGWGKGVEVPTTCENCGKELTVRSDDNPETIRKRLDVYHSQIDPIIEHYKNSGVLKIIDAMDKPEKVLESV